MSQEARKLVDAFGNAVSNDGWPAHWHTQKAFEQYAELMEYIEGIELELDETRLNVEWLRGCSDAHARQMQAKDKDIAELKAENTRLRSQLATLQGYGSDTGTPPWMK